MRINILTIDSRYIKEIRKLILILLLLPMIGFGQDNRIFCTKDLVINQVLKNTIKYIKNGNERTIIIDVSHINNHIDWSRSSLHKWRIERKNTSLYIFDDITVKKRITINLERKNYLTYLLN